MSRSLASFQNTPQLQIAVRRRLAQTVKGYWAAYDYQNRKNKKGGTKWE